jgi:hypothetical protein
MADVTADNQSDIIVSQVSSDQVPLYLLSKSNNKLFHFKVDLTVGKYGILVVIDNRTLGYSIESVESNIDGADASKLILEYLKGAYSDITVVAQGIVTCRILNAMALLAVGTVAISALYLTAYEGLYQVEVEDGAGTYSPASYYIDIVNSKLMGPLQNNNIVVAATLQLRTYYGSKAQIANTN